MALPIEDDRRLDVYRMNLGWRRAARGSCFAGESGLWDSLKAPSRV